MADKIEEPTWIVADECFPTRISYKHSSLQNAQLEARRLATQNPGRKFIVFQSVCAYEINNPVIETKYEEGCSIPF